MTPLPWRLGLVFAGGVAAGTALRTDWSGFVDAYFQERAERAVLASYARGAVGATYGECKTDPARCLGRVVAWSVLHPEKGETWKDGNASEPIVWSNEAQVPMSSRTTGTFKAVAQVRAVHPRALELVFLGSRDAPYGGTTSKSVFGLEKRSRR